MKLYMLLFPFAWTPVMSFVLAPFTDSQLVQNTGPREGNEHITPVPDKEHWMPVIHRDQILVGGSDVTGLSRPMLLPGVEQRLYQSQLIITITATQIAMVAITLFNL